MENLYHIPSASGIAMKQVLIMMKRKNLEQQLCEEYIMQWNHGPGKTRKLLWSWRVWNTLMLPDDDYHTKLDRSASTPWTRAEWNATRQFRVVTICNSTFFLSQSSRITGQEKGNDCLKDRITQKKYRLMFTGSRSLHVICDIYRTCRQQMHMFKAFDTLICANLAQQASFRVQAFNINLKYAKTL